MSQLQAPPGLDPDLYVSLTRRGGVILAYIIGGALGLLLLVLEIIVMIHAPANSSSDSIPFSSGLAGGIGSVAVLLLFNGFRLARHTRLAPLETVGGWVTDLFGCSATLDCTPVDVGALGIVSR